VGSDGCQASLKESRSEALSVFEDAIRLHVGESKPSQPAQGAAELARPDVVPDAVELDTQRSGI